MTVQKFIKYNSLDVNGQVLNDEHKLQLGGVNYECFVSLLGIRDYLIHFNELITNKKEEIFYFLPHCTIFF